MGLDGNDKVDGSEDETEERVRIPDPQLPSPEAIAEHNIDHTPYRSWCRWCVEGRGVGEQHRARGSEHEIPIIGMDYFYLTAEGLKSHEEMGFSRDASGIESLEALVENGSAARCLIVKDSNSKCMFAHVVPQKGTDRAGYAVDCVKRDIIWLGYRKMILKSDNERSIVALLKKALEMLRIEADIDQISEEHPKEYVSQSNGMTESGIKSVRGLFKTMKLHLEHRLGTRFPPKHAVCAWLLEHATMILNVRMKGTDGKTPWHRIRGRNFGIRICGFGEQAMFKKDMKGPEKVARGNISSNFDHGTYIGFDRVNCSHKYITAGDRGRILASRHLMRKPEPERWSSEALKNISIMPWSDLFGRADTRTEKIEKVEPIEENKVVKKTRQFYVLPHMLSEFGYTVGCAQCAHTQMYGKGKTGISHTKECRERVFKAMKESSKPAHQEAVAKFEARFNEALDRALGKEEEKILREEAMRKSAVNEKAELPSMPDLHEKGGELDITVWNDKEVRESEKPTQVKYDTEGLETNPEELFDKEMSDAGEDSGERVMDEEMIHGQNENDNMDVGNVTREPRDRNPVVNSSDGRNERTSRARYPMTDEDERDLEVFNMIAELGGDGKNYRRENRQGIQRLVSEIYSPPRVTKMLAKVQAVCLIYNQHEPRTI